MESSRRDWWIKSRRLNVKSLRSRGGVILKDKVQESRTVLGEVIVFASRRWRALRPEHWRVFTEGAESVHQLHSKWVEVVLALSRKWASIVAAVDFEVMRVHCQMMAFSSTYPSRVFCVIMKVWLSRKWASIIAALDFEITRGRRQMMAFLSTLFKSISCHRKSVTFQNDKIVLYLDLVDA